MPRLFTLEQAAAVLPLIEGSLRDLVGLKGSLDEIEAELREAALRVAMLGGAIVDGRKLAATRNRAAGLSTRIQQTVKTIQSHGCVVKDFDRGLIDFPTLYRDNEVYLCWKLGESKIAWWHGVDEGFRGRKQIDQDFLDHHRGGA